MTDELVVTLFNVGFGDGVLVTFPQTVRGRAVTRSILFDMGNALAGTGSDDTVFETAAAAIAEILDGRDLDLYVMTHEHMDHVQGPLYLATKGIDLRARRVWMTASAEGKAYYDRFPEARAKRLAAIDAYRRSRNLAGLAAEEDHEAKVLFLNNLALDAAAGDDDLQSNRTKDCVEAIRRMAPHVDYVHRGARRRYGDATITTLGPEEDTAAYYGRFRPLTLAGGSGLAPARGSSAPGRPEPPPGVDAGTFYDLVERRANGWVDALLTIDRAENNTSVVAQIEWRGWRLLFPGDAEVRSWQEMARQRVLEPVDFLKVAHHGSHNGTPPDAILDLILPVDPARTSTRFAAVSTCADNYSGVPDDATLDRLRTRAKVSSTEGRAKPLVLRFPART